MADKPWYVGIYGPGDVNPQAVNDLLMDWLPEDAVVLMPSHTPPNSGLRNVADWVTEVKQDHQLVDVPDVIVDLITYGSQGHPVYLVLLWGEEGDKQSEDLLHDATNNNILVKDLTSALDDLQLEDDEPEVEEVIEPDDTTSLLGGDQGPIPNSMLQSTNVDFDPENLVSTMHVGHNPSLVVLNVLESWIVSIVERVLDERNVKGVEEAIPMEDEEILSFYKDKDSGVYRKVGRGRMRKNEERVELPASKAKELGIE